MQFEDSWKMDPNCTDIRPYSPSASYPGQEQNDGCANMFNILLCKKNKQISQGMVGGCLALDVWQFCLRSNLSDWFFIFVGGL